MYQTNGSGPLVNPGPGSPVQKDMRQINGGPGMAPAPQPQNVYGGGAPSHAMTLADLVAQYRANRPQPTLNPNNPGMPQTPAQPAMSQFQQRRQQFRENGQHPMMSRLFRAYFQ